MDALGLYPAPTPDGWAVYLSDGRTVASFHGLFARQRALRYLAGIATARRYGGSANARAALTRAAAAIRSARSRESQVR